MNNVVQFRGIFRNNKLTPVRRFYKVVTMNSARQLYSIKVVSCAAPLWSACLALVQFSREHVSVPVATFPRNFRSHIEADHLVAFSYEQLFQGAQPALATDWGVCLSSSYNLVLDD